MKFILDASVYISFYSPSEVHHNKAKQLWAICPEKHVFHVPQIFPLEVLSGFARRKMDATGMSEQESFIATGPKFAIHPLSQQIVSTASAIIKSARLRSADAVYLALAHELKGTLITLDHELANVLSRKDDKFTFEGFIVDPSLKDFDKWEETHMPTDTNVASLRAKQKKVGKSKGKKSKT